jgi:hypothetical protein
MLLMGQKQSGSLSSLPPLIHEGAGKRIATLFGHMEHSRPRKKKKTQKTAPMNYMVV